MPTIKSFAKLLKDVRDRSDVEAINGAMFTISPERQYVVRANYEGFVMVLKLVNKAQGEDRIMSHGVLLPPKGLLKLRKCLSLVRIDALRDGALQAALNVQRFAKLLISASDGKTRTVAIVFDDPKDRINSAGVEQEFVKHIKDYNLDIGVGGILFDCARFEGSVSYQKASATIAKYGYPNSQSLQKIFGKLARDDAARALALSAGEVNELRAAFRALALDLLL